MVAELWIYNWPSNNVGVRGTDLDTVKNRNTTFDSPKLKLSLSILRRLGLGSLWIPKSEDAQVPCIKLHRCSQSSVSMNFQLQIKKQYRYLLKKVHIWADLHSSTCVVQGQLYQKPLNCTLYQGEFYGMWHISIKMLVFKKKEGASKLKEWVRRWVGFSQCEMNQSQDDMQRQEDSTRVLLKGYKGYFGVCGNRTTRKRPRL